MTDNIGAVKEAERIFGTLARVQCLVNRADIEENLSVDCLLEAIRLLELYTLDFRWRDEILSYLPPANRRLVDEGWKIEILNSLNATIARAKDSGDHIVCGNLFLKCGMYNDAFTSYNKSQHATLLISHMHLLQGNWAYNHTTLGRMFLEQRGKIGNALLMNLGLSFWCTRDFANCVSVLVHLEVSRDENGRYRFEDGVWLSHESIRTMLIISSLLAFTPELLNYFKATETLVRNLHLHDIIDAFADNQVERFWELFYHTAEYPLIYPSRIAERMLRDKLHQNWLFTHNRVAVDIALRTFSYRRPKYSEIDLVEDVNRWKSPYRVDLVSRTISLSNIRKDPNEWIEAMIREYERDALILIWYKNLQD